MKTGYIFIILLGIAFLLSAFTTLGYLIYYRYYLSKCIENGLKKRNKLKKLIEPFRFFLISFILFSIISCTFVSVENYSVPQACVNPEDYSFSARTFTIRSARARII